VDKVWLEIQCGFYVNSFIADHTQLTEHSCVRAAIAVIHWLCVCLSVTLMYCAKTIESIIMQSSLYGSPAILVFPYEI